MQKTFYFYGKNVTVNIDDALLNCQTNVQLNSEKKVKNCIQTIHQLNMQNACASIFHAAEEMHLDGLGYMQLLKKYSTVIFPNSSFDFKKIVVWYALRFKNYDCLLLLQTDKLHLFFNTDFTIDGGTYLALNGTKYFCATPVDLEGKSLTPLDIQLFSDSAKNVINFNPNVFPLLGKLVKNKTREFNYNGKQYVLNTQFNDYLVNYLNDLPPMLIGSYLYNFSPSEEAEKSLNDSVSLWLIGKTYNEKLAFLLKLVQDGFAYKADIDYRKSEKRNFVEQSLADEFIDCEDKAVLFCYLINKYLSAETILLYSKSQTHVCCALELPSTSVKYSLQFEGKPYLICEPSFGGYAAGETEFSKQDIKDLIIYK